MNRNAELSSVENELLDNKNIKTEYHESIKFVFKLFKKTLEMDGLIEEINIELADEWKTIAAYNLICIDKKYICSLNEKIDSKDTLLKEIIDKIDIITIDHIKNSDLIRIFKHISFVLALYIPLLHEYCHKYDKEEEGTNSLQREKDADSRAMSCSNNIFETYKQHLLLVTSIDEKSLEKVLSLSLMFSCSVYVNYLENASASNSLTHPSSKTRGQQSVVEIFKILRKRKHPELPILKNFIFIYSRIYGITTEEAGKKFIEYFDE